MSSSATLYAATQDGYACFCGAEEHAAKYVTSKNEAEDFDKACSIPCGPGHTGESPAGKAGEKCGGPWANTTMRVQCGLQWGTQFLLLLAVAGGAYLAGGVFGPWSTGSRQGLAAKDMLRVHPHYLRWVEVGALVQDGVTYAKARRSGRPMPQRSRAEQQEERGGRGDGGKRTDKRRKERREGGEKGERGASDGQGKRESRGSKKEKKAKGREPELAEPLVSAAPAAPAPASGTAAGGGGRWVHVPN